MPLVTSRPTQRVDAAGDQDVVDQGDQHRDRVLGLEPDRDVGRDHEQAEDDRDHRLAGDLRRRRSGPTDCELKLVSPLSSPKRRRAPAGPCSSRRAGSAPGSGSRSRRSRGSRSPGSSPRRRRRCRRRSSARSGRRRRVAGSASAASIRVPDSKSIPRLSCLVANAIAPIARITPEIEKKYFEAPVKSKFQLPALAAGAEQRSASGGSSSARAGRGPPA